jgi:AraC-like DNA-binding protein
MQLLSETEFKITEIASRVGYKSSAAFIRRFTANFGFAPGRMRVEAMAAR